MSETTLAHPVVELSDVAKYYRVDRAPWRAAATVRALDGISLVIHAGETMGLVGESGSGKSTAAKLIVGLAIPDRGKVLYRGEAVPGGLRGARTFHRHVQIVFQNPWHSLNPRQTTGALLVESLRYHWPHRYPHAAAAQAAAADALCRVGLTADHRNRLPHELSGGQRQRVALARALTVEPELLVCDEPVSFLDVSVRNQMLSLLQRLKTELNLTYLFIAHDLSIVRQIADRVAVMFDGKIVELAGVHDIFSNPLHPYTQRLCRSWHDASARPAARVDAGTESDANGCRYYRRCPLAMPRCREAEPGLREMRPGQWVSCHAVEA